MRKHPAHWQSLVAALLYLEPDHGKENVFISVALCSPRSAFERERNAQFQITQFASLRPAHGCAWPESAAAVEGAAARTRAV